jgi:hypothetical protein
VPQEQLRLRIPRDYLNDYISLIKEYVPLVPAELIFDLHETGLSDWEERKTKPVIIPSHASSSTVHYPIDRAIRDHTLLCCVSASGDAYSPLLIAPHPKARRIFEKGIRENVDSKVGFRYHQRDGIFYLAVDEGIIRGAPDFCEIWERNYPIESLSAQMNNQK